MIIIMSIDIVKMSPTVVKMSFFTFQSKKTSRGLESKVIRNFHMVGLTLLIVLKINPNCRDGPSGHDGIFFGIILPPSGVATVVRGNFVLFC